MNPALPEPVERVILKALAKDPADRFQSVGPMVEALQRGVAEAPVPAEVAPSPPPPVAVEKKPEPEVAPSPLVELAAVPEEEAVPFWQKVPVWGWAAVGAAVLLIAAGAIFLGGRGGKPTPTPVAVSVPTATGVPTVTPVPPTRTPAVPTDTPTPVPTDTPTPTTTSTETPTETSTVTPAPSLTSTSTSTSTPTAEPIISPELLDQIQQILNDWRLSLQKLSPPPTQQPMEESRIDVNWDTWEWVDVDGTPYKTIEWGIEYVKRLVYPDGKVEYYEMPGRPTDSDGVKWDHDHAGFLRFEVWPDGTKYEHEYKGAAWGWKMGEEKVIDITEPNNPKTVMVITSTSWYENDGRPVVSVERNLETGETATLYFAKDGDNYWLKKKKTDKGYEWFDRNGYLEKVTSDEEGNNLLGRIIRNQADKVVGQEYKDLDTGIVEYYEINSQGKELFLRFVFDEKRGLKEYNEEGVVILTIPSTEMPTPVPPTDTPTPTPHLTGKIAYVMKDGIYVMDADGSNRRRVYEGDLGGVTLCSDWGPMGRAVLSPDGSKIAFMRKDGPWVMDANGSGLQQIVTGECTFHVTWAPDSKQIFYKAGEGGAYIVKIPGGIPEHIGGGLHEVDWSPDGSWLAYPSGQGLVKRPVWGGSEFVLDPSVGQGVGPAWSPDSTRIAYAKNGDIVVINADGSGPTRLTDHPAGDWEPRWSPDGRKIIFTSDRDGNREIYVMNPDGSNPMNLTNSAENEEHPSWAP
jgi:Tol biopolymer transport system component